MLKLESFCNRFSKMLSAVKSGVISVVVNVDKVLSQIRKLFTKEAVGERCQTLRRLGQ